MGKATAYEISINKNKVIAFVTDAFGGHGGIALYNRDLLTAISTHEAVCEITVFPRISKEEIIHVPKKINLITSALGGKFKYLASVFCYLARHRDATIIICAHINLLPIAYIAKLILRSPIILEIYGIEAWETKKRIFVKWILSRVDHVISISEITKKKIY